MKGASKHEVAGTSRLSDRLNELFTKLHVSNVCCCTSSHLPALQGGGVMLFSADTEVEEVAVSKGLKAITSVALKNEGIVAIFTNELKELLTLY